jgi:hypothetical protein
MWIVGIDIAYYPDMVVFNTYEEAKAYYDKQTKKSRIRYYLAEVKESK